VVDVDDRGIVVIDVFGALLSLGGMHFAIS
jgi:hypothetical protein